MLSSVLLIPKPCSSRVQGLHTDRGTDLSLRLGWSAQAVQHREEREEREPSRDWARP